MKAWSVTLRERRCRSHLCENLLGNLHTVDFVLEKYYIITVTTVSGRAGARVMVSSTPIFVSLGKSIVRLAIGVLQCGSKEQ